MGKFKLKPAYPPKEGFSPHAYPSMPIQTGSEDQKVVNVDGTEFTVIKIELEPGIMGEANNDGTIFVNKDIPDGSIDEAEVVAHEDKHMKDMESGLLDYGDDFVEWDGKRYERKDGKIKYNGKWIEEGDKNFPWEKRAYKAGNAAVKKLKNKYGRK
tara:strand:- start:189 stop:656 length:468 start_codon:yes stop_codon:yes gene_type:complete